MSDDDDPQIVCFGRHRFVAAKFDVEPYYFSRPNVDFYELVPKGKLKYKSSMANQPGQKWSKR